MILDFELKLLSHEELSLMLYDSLWTLKYDKTTGLTHTSR